MTKTQLFLLKRNNSNILLIFNLILKNNRTIVIKDFDNVILGVIKKAEEE